MLRTKHIRKKEFEMLSDGLQKRINTLHFDHHSSPEKEGFEAESKKLWELAVIEISRKKKWAKSGSRYREGQTVYMTGSGEEREIKEVVKITKTEACKSEYLYQLEGEEGLFGGTQFNKRKPKSGQLNFPDEESEEEIFKGLGSRPSPEKVLEAGLKLNAKRSSRAVFKDRMKKNKRVLYPNKKNLKKWWFNPGQYDLAGVDTPNLKQIKVKNLLGIKPKSR